MQVPSLQAHLKAADLPLEKLAGNTKFSEADKIQEVSRQFEAILLRQILASAQKQIFPSTMNPESSASGIYRDMTTSQLADQISRSGEFGLGKLLANQLNRQLVSSGAAAQRAAKHE
jgi:Rod binding domain-containing protein